MANKEWTAKDDAQLRACAAAGNTAQQAADKLGVTRNAAIGRAHRIGVCFNSKSPQNSARMRKKV